MGSISLDLNRLKKRRKRKVRGGMNLLITICARGGSRGLPGKATKLFNGKPLCQWTMEQALDFGSGKVVVSSDDPVVLSIARDMGLDYFARSDDLCQDDTPKLDVLRDVLHKFGPNKFDCVIDLDITNPCRTLEDIKNCLNIFGKKRHKTLFSVTKGRKSPYFNQVFLSEYENPEIAYEFMMDDCIERDDYINITRRQDAPEVYDMNASIYLYDPKWLMNPDNLSPIIDDAGICLMPDWTFCDIDNEVDFEVAQFLHKKYMAQA